jgi:hypothetical protein
VSVAPSWMVERAIILQLLRDDHDERWMLADLVNEIPDLGRRAIRDGLACLVAEGRRGDAGRVRSWWSSWEI